MAKKNLRNTKQPAKEAAAMQAAASAGVVLQTLSSITPSKPTQSPAQQVQSAPAKAVAAQGSLTSPSLKPATPPESARLLEKVAVAAEAALPSDPAKVRVTFVLPACPCSPKRVSLSGDFNGWSSDATPMKRCDDGHWQTTIELAPGRYEYKFVRDGEWMPDLLARENVLNAYGTLNSVIEVRPDNH